VVTRAKATPTASEAWEAGFREGTRAALALVEKAIGLQAIAVALKVDAPSNGQRRKRIAELVAGSHVRPDSGESPAQKSARLSRTRREIRDAELASELALHVNHGATTEEARAAMGGIGIVRAQRVRALAVRMGLIKPRQVRAATG
jgi:hypothetical protein